MKSAIYLAVLMASSVAQADEPTTKLQPEGCIQVEVNYDLKPIEMAEKYDWMSTYIQAGTFPATPRGQGKVIKEVCWFQFDSDVNYKQVLKKIESSNDFLAADLWELHALMTKSSKLQLKKYVVGLGSKWSNENGFFSPYLVSSDDEISLALGWFEPEFHVPWLIAAVRK